MIPTPLEITPETLNVNCVYTLLTAASHHDPNLGVDANINLYNRQRVRQPYAPTGTPITDAAQTHVAEAFPIPEECFDIFADEPFERFVGIALMKVFMDKYTAGADGDGTGIFEGVARYTRLYNRIELAAPRSANLKAFWSILCQDMKCGPVPIHTQALFTCLAVPSRCHQTTLYELQKNAAMVVEMAHFWRKTELAANEKYATRSKLPQSSGKTKVLTFQQKTAPSGVTPTETSVAIPVHSGNDIRHDIRAAAMLHLFESLGFSRDTKLPASVKAMLENGGNIGKGVSAPSNDYSLTQTIRAKYPSLGLLGGCTSSFMLGDSNLHSVAPFWFGRENNRSLEKIFGVHAEHSLIDMLDDVTLHRHSGRWHDTSPMPYSFETVVAGSKLYVNFQFSPYTTDLERGAFWCALETYLKTDGHIGGQSAKGYGKADVEILRLADDVRADWQLQADRYETYLQHNLIELTEGLQTGELCTGKKVCV